MLHKHSTYICICLVLFIMELFQNVQASSYEEHPHPKDLADWKLIGKGNVEVIEKGHILKLSEGSDSKGVVLLSPKKYPANTVLNFSFKPLQHKGIGVVLHSISNVDGQKVTAPDNYDGNLNFWRSKNSGVQNYIFTFHTAYHQPNLPHAPYAVALLRKNPGFKELGKGKDMVVDEEWHAIEIGRQDSTLWLSVDGNLVFKVNDSTQALPGGHIALRLRGPGDGSFSSLYKDFSIKSSPASVKK